ncbi:MAG: hypothetical protein ACFFAO_12500 [Candidatus Hermodarchaeota archaeon]
MGKFWNKLKGFWQENLLKRYKELSAKTATFISTILDLFIIVIGHYTAQIPIKVWGDFLYGGYIALVVVITGWLFWIMKNGNGLPHSE